MEHQHKLQLGRIDRRATSLDGLWAQIQQVWDGLDIGQVNRLVDSMEERRRNIAAARRGYTRFQTAKLPCFWREDFPVSAHIKEPLYIKH